MNIKRVVIEKLYGYLDKTIEFNKDINLLVGINGSGKTSVLNAINWVLTPSFSNLCVNEFNKIEINFTFKNNDYVIVSRQTKTEVSINLTNTTKNKKFPQIQADFKIHPSKITKNNSLKEEYISEYLDLSPEPEEIETWNFIFYTLPNPIVIGLDRNLFTKSGNEITYLEDSKGLIRKRISKINIKSPLDKVLRLAGNEYMHYKNKILELNKRLNDKIMLSSFDETLTNESLREMLRSPKISLSQVKSLEKKVKEYFQENVIGKSITPTRKKQEKEAFDKIERYFSNLEQVLNEVKKENEERFDILYITNLNQFRKIKELIKEFEDFEIKSKKFYNPIQQYLDTINVFLKDTAKELYFDKNTSKLKYKILDIDNKTIENNREIETLSSGEKQILILFTYIKFNSKQGNVFIIDEPELSLHPKWQENFLKGIKQIMPANTQLLFATHSPAIVGNNKSYCKVLMPY